MPHFCVGISSPFGIPQQLEHTFRSQLCDGWPSFSPSGDNLVYDGPLPKTCPCSVTHKAFKCVTQENEFVSSSASLGTSLYGHCHLSQRSASITPLGMAVQLQVRCRFKLEIRAHFHCLPLLHPGVHSTFLGFPGTFHGSSSSTMLHLNTQTSVYVVRLLFPCRAGRH